jgi:D-amino-acid oxidase
MTISIIRLTPPTLSSACIKENIVCIRAHRERIFCVSSHIQNNKYIFHNYGQGGAGWTFLFGCVHESLRQFEEQLTHYPALRNKPIAVIGAGCYGMLTAIMLARAGHAVRIIAKHATPSSYNAAGFFFPRPRKSSTEQEKNTFAAIGIESYKTYLSIIAGTHPFITQGPKIVPAYYGLDIDPGFGPYIEQGLMPHPREVVVDFGNGKQYTLMEYKVVFINSALVLRELENALAHENIAITRAEITDFDELEESIIFNCAGLGAKQLAHDPRIVPVQGHLISLKNQPDVEQLQYMLNVKVVMASVSGSRRDELVYFAPKEEGILGITFIRGESSLTANMHEFDRLLQRAKDFFGPQP